MSGEENKYISFKIDESSFKQLYERNWEKVYAVCYNHLGQVEVAQGMTQDIFRSLWERKDVLEITSSPERYLVRAAKFKVFEHIRNLQNREKHLERIKHDYPKHSYATEEQVMFSTLSIQVGRLIDSLPTRCREVFKMSREDGFTNKEIANILSITERAVEYHIARALQTLRGSLQEYLT